MPELPEVETLKQQFSTILIGLKIKDIQILKPKSFIGNKRHVIGEEIVRVRRFAKILVLDLSKGLSLAVHLKMSGQLIYLGSRVKGLGYSDIKLPNKHTRIIIKFESGDKLYFNDQRIFGWIKIISDLSAMVNKLGPDPLRITSKKFFQILQTSKRPIKLVLMDQEKIAGVGNIYANDALFLSKINPKTPTNKISKVRSKNLYLKLLKVLKDGIKWRGSSQNHFRDAYGRMGKKQEHFYIYSRDGEKCMNGCGGIIKRITLGGRGTFYCPECQR